MKIQPDGQIAIAAGAKITMTATAVNMNENLCAMPDNVDWGDSQSPIQKESAGLVCTGQFTAPATAGKRGSVQLTFDFKSDAQGNFPPGAKYTVSLKEEIPGGPTTTLNNFPPVPPPPPGLLGFDFITV